MKYREFSELIPKKMTFSSRQTQSNLFLKSVIEEFLLSSSFAYLGLFLILFAKFTVFPSTFQLIQLGLLNTPTTTLPKSMTLTHLTSDPVTTLNHLIVKLQFWSSG